MSDPAAKAAVESLIAARSRAVSLDLSDAVALCDLAEALNESGRCRQAMAVARRAETIGPNLAQVYNNLGRAYCGLGQFDQGIAAFERALALQPDLHPLRYNLGLAHQQIGDFQTAVSWYQSAKDFLPEAPDVTIDLSNCLWELGKFDDALAGFEQAVAQWPDNPSAHWNLGLALLSRGHLQRGFQDYEWRWRVRTFAPRINLSAPAWDGADLSGRRILLHAEQGFGDAIQFARYIPDLRRRGGRIILACHGHLHRLLKSNFPIENCVVPQDPLPAHDVHCHLLSLPRLSGTTLQTIPAKTPYLLADESLASQWKSRLPRDGRLNAGLVWAGNPAHQNDRTRSIPPERLTPLGELAAVRWISLQVAQSAPGQTATAQHGIIAPGLTLTDWTGELSDFADTAALIANLDLVVAVDTAVAHLAAALGKPTWLLLKFVPDWRWMLDRPDSPWYPTLRIFRQQRPGDWDGPIRQVVSALIARSSTL
jgi:tetratricopeptide (TPR) repeat protein